MILLIILLILLFGGGGVYYHSRGPIVYSPLGLILVVLIAMWLLGYRP